MTDTVVAEGQVKFRDGKKVIFFSIFLRFSYNLTCIHTLKDQLLEYCLLLTGSLQTCPQWKTRWVVLRKPSPVAGMWLAACVFLSFRRLQSECARLHADREMIGSFGTNLIWFSALKLITTCQLAAWPRATGARKTHHVRVSTWNCHAAQRLNWPNFASSGSKPDWKCADQTSALPVPDSLGVKSYRRVMLHGGFKAHYLKTPFGCKHKVWLTEVSLCGIGRKTKQPFFIELHWDAVRTDTVISAQHTNMWLKLHSTGVLEETG